VWGGWVFINLTFNDALEGGKFVLALKRHLGMWRAEDSGTSPFFLFFLFFLRIGGCVMTITCSWFEFLVLVMLAYCCFRR
jgi:hypothetical protein